MKKRISAFVLLGALLVLGSCTGGENSSTSTSGNTSSSEETSTTSSTETSTSSSAETSDYTRFESEYIDVTGLQGSGISGAASGVNIIQADTRASNGYFVGFSHRTGFAVTYNITSSAEATAQMKIGLGNELGVGMDMKPATLALTVNGTEVSYNKFVLQVDGFNAYDISSTLSLVAGENTIVLTVGENEYCNGGTGGPLFDYIDLKADAELTWDPQTGNLPDDE